MRDVSRRQAGSLERLHRRLQGQRAGMACILLHALSGGRPLGVDRISPQEGRLRLPGTMKNFFEYFGVKREVSLANARLSEHALQDLALFRAGTRQQPKELHGLVLREGGRGYSGSDAQNAQAHDPFLWWRIVATANSSARTTHLFAIFLAIFWGRAQQGSFHSSFLLR